MNRVDDLNCVLLCVNVFVCEQTVSDSECEMIQRRMVRLKQLQQDQQSVTETAEEAQNTNDLSALITYCAKVFPPHSSTSRSWNSFHRGNKDPRRLFSS